MEGVGWEKSGEDNAMDEYSVRIGIEMKREE